jgi:ankyrin repeat protein
MSDLHIFSEQLRSIIDLGNDSQNDLRLLFDKLKDQNVNLSNEVQNQDIEPQTKAVVYASKCGYDLIVSILCEYSSVDLMNQALLACCQFNGNIDCISVLITAKAEVNYIDNTSASTNASTPLSLSCQSGFSDAVETLLEFGATPTDRMFISACEKGKVSIVNSMILYGIDVNCSNGQGLKAAITNSNVDVVKLLLQNFINVNCVFENDITPLQLCFVFPQLNISKAVKMARMLLEYGADINYQSKVTGYTAIMLAVTYNPNGCIELVKLLLDYNIDFSILDFKGESAVDKITFSGIKTIVSEYITDVPLVLK